MAENEPRKVEKQIKPGKIKINKYN